MNEIKRIFETDASNSSKLGKNMSTIEIYDQYGAMAYGIILRIIPEPHLAQEILVEVFSSPLLQACNSYPFSFSVCVIKLARAKAVYAKRKIDLLIPKIENGSDDAIITPETIFELAFCQGYTPEEVASKLLISKSDVLKSLHEFFKTKS